MDSQLPPSSPTPTPTTISCLGDDLLREIFLRLPALPSLVRATFACCDFRRAIRSSPAFRSSFRALHAPPLLAFFLDPDFQVAPAFPYPWRSCDPELDGADLFDVCFPHSIRSRQGYFILDKVSGSTSAYYNPLTQALYLDINYISLHFYTLSSEDGEAPPRVVCVIQVLGGWARVVVFSSDTKEWQFFPENMLTISDADMAGRVMRGLIWWPNCCLDKTVVLDTTTFQFSLIDIPSDLLITEWQYPSYKLGETKDGKLCLVDIRGFTLLSYILTADDDSVIKRWMLYKEFPLNPIVKNLRCSLDNNGVRVTVVAVIDGFVYLSIFYYKDTQTSELLYLSLCLGTSEICKLFKGAYCYNLQSHPYVMAWPPSLLQSKEESETEDSVADDGPVGTEKASSVLVAALESLSQALMDDGAISKEIVAAVHASFFFRYESSAPASASIDAHSQHASLHPSADHDGITKNVMATLDAFLRPNDDGNGLLSMITIFDAQLITGRDRILRRSV